MGIDFKLDHFGEILKEAAMTLHCQLSIWLTQSTMTMS